MSNEINPSFSSSSVTFDEPVMSKALPELSEDEFVKQSIQILDAGVKNHYSKEHVTDQLFHLIHQNPNVAEQAGLPNNHPDIKKNVVMPWYKAENSQGPYIEPSGGDFEIVIIEQGTKEGPAYGATAVIRSGDGYKITEVPASSWPNPANGNPGIKEGTYSAVYRNNGHKNQTVPGVILSNNGPIETIGPNGNQDGQSFADFIHFHCGDKVTNRGSKGCPTVQPDSCGEAWDNLNHNSEGVVTLARE